MQRGNFPYRRLGERLESLRKQLKETIPEVSGAVELDIDIISSYEKGETRPSEDVLDLLISHFDIHEDEADELWELAGYSTASENSQPIIDVPNLVVVPMDSRTIYTDTANVSINGFGVVITFMQNGPGGQPVAVSRVGMSTEHAKSVYEVLGKTLAQAESNQTKKLLPGQQNKKPKN